MTAEEAKTMRELAEKVKEQDEVLKKLLDAPKSLMTTVKVNESRAVLIDGNGSTLEVEIPPNVKIRPGTVVRTVPHTGAIFSVDNGLDPMIGAITTVIAIHDKEHAEVEVNGGRTIVMISDSIKKLKVGHRVRLDPTSHVIMDDIGAQQDEFKVPEMEPVQWSDIGGLPEAKRTLAEAVELSAVDQKILAKYGRKPPRGIMLYGPPGCGKTMLAKAVYTSLAKTHGSKARTSGFIYVKGPEILTMWVGESESKVRGMFHRAREHFDESGFPAVIFLDEADAILGRRGHNRISNMSNTIVPQFLSEMDGMASRGQPLVLIATNRPDSLDPAVVRDGRIDRRIRVARPGRKEIEEIFEINFKGKPLRDRELAVHGSKELTCDSRIIMQITDDRGEIHNMTMAHAVNGAMVAGIVDRAAEIAMRRELDQKKPDGLTRMDIDKGIQESAQQMVDIDLSDEIVDFAEQERFTIKEASRYRQ